MIKQTTTGNPRRGSRRYAELIALYRQMHEKGLPASGGGARPVYRGHSLRSHLHDIRWLIRQAGATSLLDYGCGKAELYLADAVEDADGRPIGDLQSWLSVERIALYDPAVADFSELPEGTFDGVVSTDVLEHCPEDDIDWILKEIFGKARRFVFANIAAYPAQKTLPDGRNAHATVRPAEWWRERLAAVAARHPAVSYRVVVDERPAGKARGLARLWPPWRPFGRRKRRVVLERLSRPSVPPA